VPTRIRRDAELVREWNTSASKADKPPARCRRPSLP
jgi:hypothetical protein